MEKEKQIRNDSAFPEMLYRLRLVDEPESGAIRWNYFFRQTKAYGQKLAGRRLISDLWEHYRRDRRQRQQRGK